MASAASIKKSEPQGFNIQSYIRVRPLTPKEKKAAALEISNKKEIIIKSLPDNQRTSDKTLRFDRVFDEKIEQVIVYNTVVKPLVKEVLQGYNCTVFAYGQTGTGKTYTMTGEENKPNETCVTNVHAGIIPRALEEIFEELESQKAEYQVSVVYLELYNEKLRSLLSGSTEDEDIKLEEDSEKRVNFKGLHPTPVESIQAAYKLLQQGAEKRKTASTNMNIKSSRSHTIFTINVTMKEVQEDGGEYELRLGKLNLVDLAGSENVSKSGANEGVHKDAAGVNHRLAEASNINKSLLVLGRVIKCLTINNTHIPYRESKLTRLLQDSLGGCTKTCIIGTISPAHGNFDESENTLNYALMARSILNKPVKNRMISRKHFLKEATEEIAQLKRDLEAQRQGQGVFISQESHAQMQDRTTRLEEQCQDWITKYRGLKEKLGDMREQYEAVSSELEMRGVEHQRYIKEQERLHQDLYAKCAEFEADIDKMKQDIRHREYLIKKFEEVQGTLTQQAVECQSVIEILSEDSRKLHDKIDRQAASEQRNISSLSGFKENVDQEIKKFESHLEALYTNESSVVHKVTNFAGQAVDLLAETSDKLKTTLSEYCRNIDNSTKENLQLFDTLGSTIEVHLESILRGFSESLTGVVSSLQCTAQDKWHPQLQQMSTSLQPVQQLMADAKLQLQQLENETRSKGKNIRELCQSMKISVDKQFKIHEELEAGMQNSVDHSNELVAAAKQNEQKLHETWETMTRLFSDFTAKTLKGQENAVENQKRCAQLRNQAAAMGDLPDQALDQVTGHIHQTEDLTTSAASSIDKMNQGLQSFESTKKMFEEEVGLTLRDTGLKLDEINQSSKEDCEKVSTQVNQCLRDVKDNMQKSLGLTKGFEEHMQGEWNQQEKVVVDVMREGNSGVVGNLKYLRSHQSQSEQRLTALSHTASHVQFHPYQPQGMTPQRRDTLEYPRQLVRLDTSDLMVQTCLAQMSSRSPQEELLESSEASDCTYTVQPTSPTSCAVLKENNPTQQNRREKQKKLRRSLSLTNVSDGKENAPQLLTRFVQGKKLSKTGSVQTPSRGK